jgi:PAS domain S-box-containing protein
MMPNNHDVKELSLQIVALAPDAILFADREGLIRLWNQGAERIFGYPAEEAIGQSLDLIIPEKLRARHWQGYHRTMATGETRYGSDMLSVPATHRNGSKLSTEFSIVMLFDDDNQPYGIAAIMRDVTQRHIKEKQLRERLTAIQASGQT